MRDASPAFQPDRPGAPGFQLAEDLGFQTQVPAAVGLLEVVLSLDGVTARYSPRNSAIGDLLLVLGLDAVTRGPRPQFTGGTMGVYTYPNRWTVVGDLALVLTLDAVTRFRPAPAVRRAVLEPELDLVLTLDATTRALDYVRDVLEPETEDLLLLV